MTRWRRPAWWSVLLTVAAAALFVRLGVWQLDRAAYKDSLVRRYAAAAAAPPVPFGQVAVAPPADAFPRVTVRGRWLADRVYLLDNPHHDARGGVEVYAPLALPGASRLLLVDLGFLPGTGNEQAPPLPPLPAGEADLHGLYLPPPGVGLELGGDALAGQVNWPKTTIYLDLPQVAKDLGRPLYPRVLALDADPTAVYQREHAFDFSSMPPARHRAYAFQWFSFAVAVVAIFLVLHRKRRPRRTENP
ncbi:MAG TPA: SURF1 family protein [Frateuria sp.]|uniref:SURF1 family protein n=1 Tax=Frateuria sp. TaxID=2211372 RepID=UPI002D80DE1F|nr:SURF1 family protein [Frateuria sp.]HET6804355.1 SURF1 family protein [Frateuria sp.]